jgi:hypothetical protein
MSEDFKEISWTPQLEEHFASAGEKAHCYSWCHKKSEEKYSRLRTFIDLPVICLSSVCGFLQIGSDQMFADENAAAIGLGLLSLFVALLSATQTYFKWSARAEAHRISAIQWSRLYRHLSIEMNLPRDERKAPQDLLKDTQGHYDRLQEISPLIPPDVIETFRKNFDKYKDISKPEEANGLEKIVVYSENPLRKIASFISDNGTPNLSNTSREQTSGPTHGTSTIPESPKTPSEHHDSGAVRER